MKRPNILFVFGDQWRAQATGYFGEHRDPGLETPNLDSLARQSVRFRQAVSGAPVCSPYRASLLTGLYPLRHGVFINDARLHPGFPSLGKSLRAGGYRTGWIGKWHVDGHGRRQPIPPERRHGFEFWRTLECGHDYRQSPYHSESGSDLHWWDEPYDAYSQTQCAIEFLAAQRGSCAPFALFLSWGPPHDPYDTAPEEFKALYPADQIRFRENVPPEFRSGERRIWNTPLRTHLQGYYAHCTALDRCVGRLEQALHQCGLAEDTILVFTSDHGDMLGSQGQILKQVPYEESVRVPFLLRYPRRFGWVGKEVDAPIDAPDLMPTLLRLCHLPVPPGVQGRDFTPALDGPSALDQGGALLSNIIPFGNWHPGAGGREYRGWRTSRYSYLRHLEGPWLLFDHQEDPWQLHNRVGDPALRTVERELEDHLQERLESLGDRFEPGHVVASRWGYSLGARNLILDHGPGIPPSATP